MRYAALTTLRIGVCVGLLAWARFAIGGEPDRLARARTLISGRSHGEAAEVLEDTLPHVQGTVRAEAISMLRQTYTLLAKDAEEHGRAREAALYRDNLAILNREPVNAEPPANANSAPIPDKPREVKVLDSPKPEPAKAPGIPPRRENVTPPLESPADQTLPKPQRLPEPEPLPPPESAVPQRRPASAMPDADLRVSSELSPNTQPETPPQGVNDTERVDAQAEARRKLVQADQFFHDKKYEEAGKIYSQLASRDELPNNRNEVWAYCRWTEIVKRINAKPRSAKEWDAIVAEIQSVRQLSPNNWYGEYLMSRVAEARKSRRSIFPSRSKNEKLLVRGSEPEEVEVKLGGEKPSKSQVGPKPRSELPSLDVGSGAGSLQPARQPEPVEPSGTRIEPEAPTPQQPAPAVDPNTAEVNTTDRWQIRESPNFRIFHHAPELAERAAQVAESVRAVQGRRWTDQRGEQGWTPKCDLYLYSDAKAFARMTGQPETSPGFTMMGANSSRIISRRVNLRADHPQMLTAILPHEVTHVVLADLFPNQPIPRWADEGMAVLAEPPSEQSSRAAELGAPLRDNRIFPLSDLIALDSPETKDWATFYAQSVSLTKFLVDQGNPRDFIRFLQASQRSGYDTALRSVYRINDLAELQEQWLQSTKEQVSTPFATRPLAERPTPADSEIR